MHRLFALFLLLAVVLFSGCAATTTAPVDARQDQTPLFVQYDIRYVDQSTVGLDLMIVSSELSQHAREIESAVFRSVNEVAREIERSELLADQGGFRQAVQERLRQSSVYGESVRLVVVDVVTRNIFAQR